MNTYIVLLRGINVSGQKKIKMLDLKTMLQALGFKQVNTYIQSGNIVLRSNEPSSDKISQTIMNDIQKTFGYKVPVQVRTLLEVQKIRDRSPYRKKEIGAKNSYYVLLHELPNKDLVQSLQQEQFPNEQFVISEKCIYLNCDNGYGNAKCNNNFFERKLKVVATTRNHRTILKLLEMAGGK